MKVPEETSPGTPPPGSVIVANYNYSRFIEAAIRSVAAQTYPWFRCVIVDDHSTDNSAQTVESVLAQLGDSRFELFRRSVNGGQTAAMASGFERTSEPFVAFLDADDLWQPDFLAEHIRAHLNTARPVAFTCSDLALIDANGALLAGTMFYFEKDRSDTAGGRIRLEHLPVCDPDARAIRFGRRDEIVHKTACEGVRHWSAMSAMVFRRAVLELIWPDDHPALRVCSDHYMPLLAHYVSGSILLANVLAFYRIHEANQYARNLVLGGTVNFADRDWTQIHAAQDSLAVAHIQRRRAEFDTALEADRTAVIIARLCGVERIPASGRTTFHRSRRGPGRILKPARRALRDASRALEGWIAALRRR
jgi:glycosyltransferase involved in cell wall biosynthesis